MPSDRDEFRRLMGEAAARPPDDPARLEIEQRIAEDQAWAQEWSELMRENECLRAALPAVDVPADLEERLLETMASGRPRKRSNITRWLVAAAAVVAIAVGGWLAATNSTSAASERVALLAIESHRKHGADDVGMRTSDLRELARSLSDGLSFAVSAPDFQDGVRLVGGRTCSLGEHAVAFSWWQATDGGCSLFQFEPEDFGLPARMARRFFHPKVDRDSSCACIWGDGSRGYVLVGTGHEQLERVLGDEKEKQ